MCSTVAVAVFPATSAIEAETESAPPSPEMTLSDGHAPAMPESASEHVQWTVTSPLYQPLALGALVGAPLMVGATLSMFTPLTVVAAVFPAASSAVPGTDWFAPWPSVTGLVHESIPESASSQANVTVTLSRYQLAAL